MPTNARERLLDAAEELFYTQGTRGTGVEQILATSGVGRASFYRHFAGKDDLIVAVLQRRRQLWSTRTVPQVRERGGHPLDAFDVLALRLEETGYRGCAFLNTLVEIPDPQDPAHRQAIEQKADQQAFFAELLAAHGYVDEDGSLARQLLMLHDGAAVAGLRERSPRAALDARRVAEVLLAAAAAARTPSPEPAPPAPRSAPPRPASSSVWAEFARSHLSNSAQTDELGG